MSRILKPAPAPAPPSRATGAAKLGLVSSISFLLFGYDTGIVSGAMLKISAEYALSAFEHELVVSATIALAVVGAGAGGALTHAFGRRPVIHAGALIFTVGALVMALAPGGGDASRRDAGVLCLVCGRMVVGLAIGLATSAVPMYVAETCVPAQRGRMVALQAWAIPFGQCVACVTAGLLATAPSGWRWMLGLGAVPSALQLALFLALPESPRWLLARGRAADASHALGLLRGLPADAPEIAAELGAMVEANTADAKVDTVDTEDTDDTGDEEAVAGGTTPKARAGSRGAAPAAAADGAPAPAVGAAAARASTVSREPPPWYGLKSAGFTRALTLGCGLQLLQQLVGINTVMYYSASILRTGGLDSDASAIWGAAFIAAVNLVGAGVGVRLVERAGRRPLTLISLAVVTVALVALAAAFWAQQSGVLPDSLAGLATLCALALYIAGFSPGMGPMPWTINSEIYAMEFRSLGSSASAAVNWGANFVISVSFLSLCEWLGAPAAFLCYAACGAAGLVWLYGALPETRGKSLEEIDALFEAGAHVAPPLGGCGCARLRTRTRMSYDEMLSAADDGGGGRARARGASAVLPALGDDGGGAAAFGVESRMDTHSQSHSVS